MPYTLFLCRDFYLFCLVMLNTDEHFSSEEEKEDTSTPTCYPHLKAYGKDSSISHGVKRHDRVCLEESGGATLYGQSSTAREGLQRHMIMDPDEKPKISFICGKTAGNVTVYQCNNTVCEMTPSHTKNTKSHQSTYVADECCAQDQSTDVKQSTSLPTEAELHETKRSAPCQTVCINTCCRNVLFFFLLIRFPVI